MLAALQSPQPPPAETLLTTLLNEIATLPDSFVLVLDDYHVLDAKPIDRALAFLLEHLPPQMHLVIATREDPQLPLARLRARGQLTELRAADLRFTSAEAAEFLNRTMGLGLSADDVTALEARTEGWIAGLQLAPLRCRPLSLQGRADTASFIESFTGTHHFMMDYLLEEVLQQQTAEVQAFLLGTSILDRLCGPLCEAVLLTPDPGFRSRQRCWNPSNAPTCSSSRWITIGSGTAITGSSRICCASGCSNRLRTWRTITCAPASWYEANGYLAEAFQHAVAARDFERGGRLAEQAWPSMEDTFQTTAWLGWIKQLPADVIRVRPVLCTQAGWSFSNAGEPETSERHLQNAERALAGAADRAEFKPVQALAGQHRAGSRLQCPGAGPCGRHGEVRRTGAAAHP